MNKVIERLGRSKVRVLKSVDAVLTDITDVLFKKNRLTLTMVSAPLGFVAMPQSRSVGGCLRCYCCVSKAAPHRSFIWKALKHGDCKDHTDTLLRVYDGGGARLSWLSF